MRDKIQMHGLYVLCGLAVAILVLMGWTFISMASGVDANGRVSGMDAGTFTGLSLMFREVLALIKSLWDTASRSEMVDQLADSAPAGRPTGKRGDPVHTEEEPGSPSRAREASTTGA